uniref:30S ribosomal protein S6, chloroplastic n=1 Tax=Campylaephora sungminbooi TaxID=1896769 RepID=A0A1B0THZ9_9FLOR|nr:ribosomal protein S6 [Campylaephora sungminbooi]AKU47330.1 ribosomal protein S6 [Campylaephora sungminbooi]ALN11777.1 ribosomal protein S6 [Campylaephora sungminbooi]
MSFSNYETIYILKPDITEVENLSLVNSYKFFIKERGGQNIYIQHRGKRHLSYTIKDYYDGIYVQMNYQANGKIVNLLEKSMKFDENIIRCLTVKQELLNTINIY